MYRRGAGSDRGVQDREGLCRGCTRFYRSVQAWGAVVKGCAGLYRVEWVWCEGKARLGRVVQGCARLCKGFTELYRGDPAWSRVAQGWAGSCRVTPAQKGLRCKKLRRACSKIAVAAAIAALQRSWPVTCSRVEVPSWIPTQCHAGRFARSPPMRMVERARHAASARRQFSATGCSDSGACRGGK